ncbi:LLM class F420-dependent oxidoreductase [Actinospica sp. MGRD01-02]|uniref:LLM class F420-dependent oxidoreductase n=1 Tax=Actinospica acidithermotolerans TaxID=2828514 RepID=A0A941IJ78_9ACTN|nr:LLM class F420-dependent oxidoreductase [Actinospica acidithermotolerans]MBR7826873.1 LLM class F420-dependent oxidoreductase [Actinospica acidithermotolerans]
MELRIFTEPQQGASYETLLAVAKAAERLGFDGFFRSDHYLKMGSVDGLPGPSDAWITLAGLARETSRLRLGTLVSPVTFRLPGQLAIIVAQVDAMSGGRVELGLGAGWFEQEHTAYGIPFPENKHALLEEQLAVVTGLWGTPVGETFSHNGKNYRLVDSPALPKPAQPQVPLIIGGGGLKRTPRLAAQYAADFNSGFASIEDTRERYRIVDEACRKIDRDPKTLTHSIAQVVCVGRDEAEIARRAAAIGREVDELRENGLTGTPAEVVAKLQAYAAAGAERAYLQVLDLSDLEHLELIAAEILPNV